jgi:hypothetical protein
LAAAGGRRAMPEADKRAQIPPNVVFIFCFAKIYSPNIFNDRSKGFRHSLPNMKYQNQETAACLLIDKVFRLSLESKAFIFTVFFPSAMMGNPSLQVLYISLKKG